MELAGAGMHGNPANDTLLKMDLDARNQKLAQTVRQSSNLCLKGIKTYFQGISTDASAYWNLRCREKDYLLVFPMDNSLGVTIVGCEKVEQAGYPCFERNDQLMY